MARMIHLSSIKQHYKTSETLNGVFKLLAMMTRNSCNSSAHTQIQNNFQNIYKNSFFSICITPTKYDFQLKQ